MELENKIEKLKKIISRYETKELLTFLAGILLQIPERHENPFLKKLMSPMRQLFYLAFINLQKISKEEKKGFSEEEWDEIATLLHEIEVEYFYLLGFPKKGKETKEDLEKIKVTMPTFMNYYFNGPLSYQEQEIERIENIFKPFENEIHQSIGLTLTDFINFYDLVNDTIDKNLNFAFKFAKPENWQEFTSACIAKGLTDPKSWIDEAPNEIMAFVNFMKNPGSFLVLNIDKLDFSKISKEKFQKVISHFIIEPSPNSELIYYTQENELLKKPFIKISETEYLPFFLKQFLDSSYHFLIEKCLLLDRDKLLKSRDKFIEQKTEVIFRKLFRKEAFFYSNYSIDNGVSEQDILILFKNTAIVIEVKASNFRAPMRDADKAFDKLKSDFKNSVQYAYKQISRVTKAFQENEKVRILNSKKKLEYELNSRKYKLYSIIVTLERFGHIQSNLTEMLNNEENNKYPWCVNIDDLEAFILTLAKKKNKIQSLFTFLEYRQNYHGHLICSDELELCGSFLKNERDFILNSRKEETIVTLSDLTQPIEESYRQGMGFDNERYLKEKKNKEALFLYNDKKNTSH